MTMNNMAAAKQTAVKSVVNGGADTGISQRKRKRAVEDREDEDEEATDLSRNTTDKSTHKNKGRPTKTAKSSSDARENMGLSSASNEFEWHNQHLENELAVLDERLKAANEALIEAKNDLVEAKNDLTNYEEKYEDTKKEQDATKEESLAVIKQIIDSTLVALLKAQDRANSRAEEVKEIKEQVKAIEGVITFQKSIWAVDCRGCRLSSEFLEENQLQSYVDGAIACQGKADVNELLASLDFDASNTRQGRVSPFICIVASSGTGKTQLAATAAQAGHVCYFYAGASYSSTLQDFYEPHRIVSQKMGESLDLFLAGIRPFVVSRPTTSDARIPPAGLIHEFFLSSNVADRMIALPLLSLLSKCLLGYDGSLASFEDLRNGIAAVKKEKKFLVFLDEVPKAKSHSFGSAMVLRNVLRALGLCPILMSTHSGAMNAIPQAFESRERGEWCRLIVKLPKFHAAKEVCVQNPWLRSSERPLVAALMVKHPEKTRLAKIVEHVKKSLEERKAGVWGSSLLQLCQLMRTKPETDETGVCLQEYNHKVCGEHFGRITLTDGATYEDLGRKVSPVYVSEAAVAFVDPEIEPVLFLAITAWKREHLGGNKGLFPLVSERNPISVRKVFEIHRKFFDEQVRVQNPNAKKLCGDRLEALALTSVTLASLQYKTEVYDATCLSEFLASTHHFMCSKERLLVEDMEKEATTIGAMLEKTSFSSVSVPTCCCAESDFSQVWKKGVWGKLERPRDSSQRDGELSLPMQNKHLLHIECKNHKDGLDTDKFKGIIERMEPNKANVLLVFTTTLTGMFHKHTWASVYGDKAGDYCVMVLKDGEAPRWLEVGVEKTNGRTELSPGPDCKALIVVLATGPV